MPRTEVYFYQESQIDVPVWDWPRALKRNDRKALIRCLAKIGALRLLGYELRRPNADFLRDGIYELRVRRGNVNYRILYFFHGQNIALLANGLTKEARVPSIEIERAIARRKRYEQNPLRHRATIQVPEDADDV